MKIKFVISLLFIIVVSIVSCSKEGPAPVNDPCAGKTIVVQATATGATACASGGTIAVTATGSSGFTYKLNTSGTYQAAAAFSNLAAGNYTVFAKDADGCEKSTTVVVASAGNAGPLFTNVKNLMAVKCQSCHNNSVQNGGMNWQVDCNIVANKARINQRAVIIGDMPNGGPSLTQDEKNIIINWLNAGGGYTN